MELETAGRLNWRPLHAVWIDEKYEIVAFRNARVQSKARKRISALCTVQFHATFVSAMRLLRLASTISTANAFAIPHLRHGW